MEMWSEENEWINIMFDFSLADIIEAVDHEMPIRAVVRRCYGRQAEWIPRRVGSLCPFSVS